MKALNAFAVLLIATVIVTLARGGHELPVYPSYYPHEIEIRSLAPRQAADSLVAARIQAYVGGEPDFSGALPDSIRAIESLGSFVIVHLNPEFRRAKDKRSTCAVAEAVVRSLAGKTGEFVFHPYPVTPFHGDYLYHADLAEARKMRLSSSADAAPSLDDLKVKASSRVARSLVPPEWSARDGDWNAEVTEVSAAELIGSSIVAVNGWLGPPWIRTGWFHAHRLLGEAVGDSDQKQRVESDLQRLTAGDFDGPLERINLERELVTSLVTGCLKLVAGYTVKREYVNTEFSAGIENVGYDSIAGLHSPMFVRTAKLKDFPWNGWLLVGIGDRPTAAWNPIGGMTDSFGRLMWYAVADPALLPSPYEEGWMLNRIADIRPDSGR